MKKHIAFVLILLIFLQTGVTTFAFTDTVANSFTSKKYNHDDKFAGYEILNGVDVSYWQSSADFSKVKAAGADFVFLRAAYRGSSKGNIVKDTKFDEYVKAAIAAGLDVGAYIYSQAITVKEAREEADFIMNMVKGYNITLPLVFDFEYAPSLTSRLRAANLTNKQRTSICNAFCARVEASGYTAMVYANQSMLTDDLNDQDIADKYDIWLANYSTSPKYAGKLYDCDYTYWQYTSSGSVAGLPGNIDCNFRYYKKPVRVTNLKISSETADSTKLSWSKVKGCYGYQIYKLNTDTGKYVKIGTTKGAATTTFTDTSSLGLVNTYKVRATTAYKGGFKAGTFSTPVSSEGVFIINVNSYGTGYATFNWQPYEGAGKYEVMRSTDENGTYSTIGTLSADTTHFTDLTKSGFKTYYYMIKASVLDANGNVQAVYYTPSKEIKKNQPSISTVYLKKNTAAQISWNVVDGATATAVYRKKNDGSFKRIKTITNNKTTTYVDKTLKKGVKYTYKVRQFVTIEGKNYYSSYTAEKYVTTLKAASVKLKSSKGAVNVTYNKITKASGYEIYMKTAGGKYTLVKTTSKLTFTKKKLTKGTKYYFKVRPYQKVNGIKIYGPFSKVKSAKPY